jgi:hypothetical protein
MRAVLLSLALMLVALPAAAQDYLAFRSPTGNIRCAIFLYDGAYARCDLGQASPSYRRPGWCDLDWGTGFGVGATGPGEALCVGDTVWDESAEVLGYGQSLSFGPFTCRSEQTGMTCLNPGGGGFRVSRGSQQVF